jgi:hypothetical protein
VTAPESSSGSSALRIGGFALLGIALVAAVLGIAALAGGGGGNDQTAAPAPTGQQTSPGQTPPPGGEAAPPTGGQPGAPGGPGTPGAPGAPGQPPAGMAQPTATGAPAGPPAGAAGGAGGAGAAGAAGAIGPAPAVAARSPLRVYNNSTIKGLAERAAGDFRSAGWTVTEVGNYSSGIIPTSTVYFQPGTGEEAAARRLGDEFGLRVEPRFRGLQQASPGLIVIATRDFQQR